MSKVLTQQQQIDLLIARVEALEAQVDGWQSIKSASARLGVSPTFIRLRLKEKAYAKTYRRLGRNYSIHLGQFKTILAKEKNS